MPAPHWIMQNTSLEITLGKLLTARGLKLAVAESCTGGLIGHRITNVSGSSAYYLGSVTAYAYEAKVRLLGVSWDTLNTRGAVSRETALEMARGVRETLDADIGVSVTGIAGPDGGTPEKPVGTVWIGLSAPDMEDAWLFCWGGDRQANKAYSAEAALQAVYDYLQNTMT
jgi:PncC family amidohydrolase